VPQPREAAGTAPNCIEVRIADLGAAYGALAQDGLVALSPGPSLQVADDDALHDVMVLSPKLSHEQRVAVAKQLLEYWGQEQDDDGAPICLCGFELTLP
jgi:hypothetical protein